MNRQSRLHLLDACRPRQWTKNLLVFAGPLFAFSLTPEVLERSIIAFAAFCCISSAIYLLNDILDIKADQAHPKKKHRPIAAGNVSIPTAATTSILLSLASLSLSASVNPRLTGVVLMYACIQVGYCFYFKRKPLLDLFCIAAGFLLRAIAGIVACDLRFSPWFLLTVGLLALFLAIEKRKAELRVAGARSVVTRKVLDRYSLPLLLRLESIVSTSAFMSYSLWAAGPTLNGASTSWMLLTVPFVLAGIFRYQLLSDPEANSEKDPEQGLCERPEDVLLTDRGILMIVGGWLFAFLAVQLLTVS